MDNLPDWALQIIAVAVGLSPGLALLMARPIGQFLRRTLLEHPEAARSPDVSRCKRSDQAKGFHGDSPSYGRPYAVDKPPPEARDAYFATATGKK
jgi:hypothetical protein